LPLSHDHRGYADERELPIQMGTARRLSGIQFIAGHRYCIQRLSILSQQTDGDEVEGAERRLAPAGGGAPGR